MESVHARLRDQRMHFPLIAKPDVGYMSRGVELLGTADEPCQYLRTFPEGQCVILQEFIHEDAEAGVYYRSSPEAPDDYEVRVALTYFPFVTGDGVRTVLQLLRADSRFGYFENVFRLDGCEDRILNAGEIFRLKISGSTRDGTIHIHLPVDARSRLAETIHAISRSLPEFWIGRYDVKFKDVEALLKGEFKILELNGAGGEDLTAWDPNKPLVSATAFLFRQMRALFHIGAVNKARGLKPFTGFDVIKAFLAQGVPPLPPHAITQSLKVSRDGAANASRSTESWKAS